MKKPLANVGVKNSPMSNMIKAVEGIHDKKAYGIIPQILTIMFEKAQNIF